MKNFPKHFFLKSDYIPVMKKYIFLTIFLIFSTNIFAKEIMLAKISKKSYTAVELEKILKRYEHSLSKKHWKRKAYRESSHFILPIKGKITNDGIRRGIYIYSRYNKVKIKAAKSGKVVYAGFLKYFGKIIIISHKNGYKTVYTYLKRLYVKNGDYIYQGEYIGEKYRTKPIYFEVRKKVYPVNILKYYSKLFHGKKISRIN